MAVITRRDWGQVTQWVCGGDGQAPDVVTVRPTDSGWEVAINQESVADAATRAEAWGLARDYVADIRDVIEAVIEAILEAATF